MSNTDWLVMSGTLLFIVLYGLWKSRGMKNIEGYLLADRQLPWYHVGLSVMATQASAITFLSAPGQAYTDGINFVQFYFGLPLAMIVICVAFIPVFQRLNVYTAYEYLENRFDNKTRTLTASLFLLQRGLSTGISIYAPAIIISTILNIDLVTSTFLTGGIVIIYTTYGGTKAVSYTQMLQMAIIFGGLIYAGYVVVQMLPQNVGFADALHIAGKMEKLDAINTEFDVHDNYNIWSGLIGGFFLQLSYFGTDQSQVGRYLTGKSVTQSRLGLIFNGLIKIPMQFFILLIGILVFTFYQFHTPPVFFNQAEVKKIENSKYKDEFKYLEGNHETIHHLKKETVGRLVTALHNNDEKAIKNAQNAVVLANRASENVRKEVTELMKKNDPKANVKDGNFIFLTFVTTYLPVGLVGLLIAIILLASMGSVASGINSLASTTVVDFYKRYNKKEKTDRKYLSISRWTTVFWGIFCMITALYAGKLGNLIEVVNVLGSLFYGTILGIFLVAFYLKRVGGTAVFIAAIIAEIFVVVCWYTEATSFLWFNLIGCLLVMGIAWGIQMGMKINTTALDPN